MKILKYRATALIVLAAALAGAAYVVGRPAVAHYRSILANIANRVATIDARTAALESSDASDRSAIQTDFAKIDAAIGQLSKWQASMHSPDLAGRSIPIKVERAEPLGDGPLSPVSATRIGPDEFLIANYRNIYRFNLASSEMRPLRLDGAAPIWNPTAVHYSAFYDSIFIANYTGADIIVAKLASDGLHLIDRITTNLKGPEGIAVSRGGRFMAVADYVGNALSLFERTGDSWEFRWTKPAYAAHGVAIIGEHVFVSGNSIAKFAIETGEELGHTDAPILFATSLSEDERTGELIGSDTMAGRVFTMNLDLHLTSSFGANGPTHSNFSMPYFASRDQHALWVLSTYQDRMLRIDASGTTSFEFAAPAWTYIKNPSAFRNPPETWRGVIKYDSPSFEFFGETIRASYGEVITSRGKQLRLPSREVGNWPYYVSTIAGNSDRLAIVSNSSPMALIYDREDRSLGAAKIGEWDCWAASDRVICPSRSYSISELSAMAAPISDDLEAHHESGEQTLLDFWRRKRRASFKD